MTPEGLAATLGILVAALRPDDHRHLDRAVDELERSSSAGEPLSPALAHLVALARTTPKVELEKDYVRLFLSPRGALCPPWAEVWVNETPRLFGPQHEAVLAFSRRFGLEPANFQRESADHVATELALAGYCLTHLGVGVFREFWEGHLRPWLKAFGQCLSGHAQTEFYRSVGLLLQDLADDGPEVDGGTDEAGLNPALVS